MKNYPLFETQQLNSLRLDIYVHDWSLPSTVLLVDSLHILHCYIGPLKSLKLCPWISALPLSPLYFSLTSSQTYYTSISFLATSFASLLVSSPCCFCSPMIPYLIEHWSRSRQNFCFSKPPNTLDSTSNCCSITHLCHQSKRELDDELFARSMFKEWTVFVWSCASEYLRLATKSSFDTFANLWTNSAHLKSFSPQCKTSLDS